MTISVRDHLLIPGHVLFRQLDDEAVLLDLKNGIYFGLNEVGARAWQLILNHGALERVLEVLQDEYAVEPEMVERDLLALADELVTRKLADVQSHDG